MKSSGGSPGVLGRFLTGLVTFVLCVSLFGSTAAALTDEQIKTLESGARYFNTEIDVACATNSVALVGGENAEKVWNYLVGRGLTPIATAGVMGNLQKESGFNPQRVQGTKTPDGDQPNITVDGNTGYGIAQWTSSGRQQALADFAATKSLPSGDLGVQLEFLYMEAGGVWEAMNQKTDVRDATLYFHSEFERSADGEEGLNQRVDFALGALAQFGSSVSPGVGVTSTSASGCSGAAGNGAVAGSIVQTALNLALPEYIQHAPNREDAKPEYVAAHDQFINPVAPAVANLYAACDVFVATVMRASGVDPDYQVTQTTEQLKYVQSHPEKYEILPPTLSEEGLQPGDILINSHHTVLYTGPQPNGYNLVDSSNGERVPMANHWGGWEDEPYTVVRVKQ